MEEKKEKKTIKCSYAVLVIILFAALAFVTDYAFIERKTSKCDCPKCEATNNEVISGNIENKDNTDDTQVTDKKEIINNVDISSLEYIKTTELNTGCSSEINVKIEDGNIIFTKENKVVKYNNVDAKVIHWGGILDCGSTNIFYLTNDGNLYELKDIYRLFDDEKKPVSYINPFKLGDNVSEIVESVSIDDSYNDFKMIGKGIKVLTRDNVLINYYWTTFYPPSDNNLIEKNW